MEYTLNSMYGISGKTVVVTGGCGGIGYGLCQALSALGAKVAILDMNPENSAKKAAELEAQTGNMVRGYAANVADEPSVEAAFEKIEADFGSVYGLVNCAGISHVTPLSKMPMDAWQRVIDVNLRGTVICSKVAQKYMRKQRVGRIINISSLASTVGKVGYTAYTPSKAAIDGFTYTLAVELGRLNITVNAIAPVFVLTEINKKQWAGVDNIEEKMSEGNPMGKICSPQRLAGLMVFLLSDAADFITGEVIGCNGGMTHGLVSPMFPQETYEDAQ